MITVERCNNGLRIVSEHMPHVRSVTAGIFVKAGSRNERPEENGLTHFIEHMLFKGTEKRTAKQIAEEFDRIGGQVNAYTSKEYTSYYAKVLDRHAPRAMEILADMFFHSEMKEEEIAKERQVVLEEISMTEDTPDDDVHEQLWKVMYPNHPMGASILGTEETLRSFSRESIKRYMARHYTPENTVISIAGNFSAELIEQIRRDFGHFAGSAQQADGGSPRFESGHSIKKRDTEQAHLCIGYPGIAVDDEDIYTMEVLNNIAGGTMSSRLFQEIREEHGLAYSVYSYHSAYADHGTFAIYAGTANGQLKELQERIFDAIDVMRKNGISAQEVEDSKEQLKGSFLLGLEGTGSRMDRNGKNELVLGRHPSDEEVIRGIDGVTTERVNALLRLLSEQPAVSVILSD